MSEKDVYNELEYLKNSLLEVLKGLERLKENNSLNHEECELKHGIISDVMQIEINQLVHDMNYVKIEIADIKERILKLAGTDGR